jgi:hypothetical protein
MKRFFVNQLVIAVIAVVAAFTGCKDKDNQNDGGGSGSGNIVGKWYFYEVTTPDSDPDDEMLPCGFKP